jgi:hypothetical protein
MTDTIGIIAIISGVSALLLGGLKIIKSSECCSCMKLTTRSVPTTPNARTSQSFIELQPVVKRARALSDPLKPRPSLIPVAVDTKI